MKIRKYWPIDCIILIMIMSSFYREPAFSQLPQQPQQPQQPVNPLDSSIPQRDREAVGSGLSSYLSLNLTGNVSEANNVIGKRDGNTTILGAKILYRLNFREQGHDFRNDLNFDYTTSKTPYVTRYLKTEDQLKLNSLYINRTADIEWFGPFARVSVKTVTTKGIDERPRDRIYVVRKRDNTVETTTGKEKTLNDPWKPTIAKETVGGYFELYQSKLLSAELMLGMGARQVLAANQLISIDDETTDEIELLELQDSRHLGLASIFQLRGDLIEEQLAYNISADMLFPFQSSTKEAKDRGAFEGRIIDLGADVAYKFSSWASLNYSLSILRDLDLSDDPQISSSVLLHISYIFSFPDQQ